MAPWLAAMLLMMAISLLVLARQHRRERHAVFLAGMMLCTIPLPALTGGALAFLLALQTLGGVQFLLRGVGAGRSWVDLALLAQCAVLPGATLAAPAALPFLQALLALELLAAQAAQVQQLRRRAQATTATPADVNDARWMSWLLALGGVTLIAPVAAQALGLADSGWLPLGLPLLMLAWGLHVVHAVGRARIEAERFNAELEQQTHERIAEVERNYTAMAETKVEQVTERERKRIAADLHDDLGAKLLTIVHTSESDRISTLAREALEEMRLSVRGLTGKPVQLLDALGDWRAEVVSRLGQANILAEWKSPAEDIIHTLPARAYVQTTRIFREAVSNIIKHSGGTHCTVSCNVQDGDFLVVIQDNGQGISIEPDGRLDRGHGMASMKARAKQMHGQCLVESGPGWGTVIRLTIPL
jgi:signal transduction histidine kinase